MKESRQLPFISVVIPALNCVEDVEGCVSALQEQDYPTGRFEVIIVDNGSTDGTLELLQRSNVRCFVREERGRARALNTGVQHARGEIICTTDISCRPEPGWIGSVAGTFAADGQVACVAGEIELLKTTDNAAMAFQERTRYMSPMAAANRIRPPHLPYADGANASFRKRLFDEIGGFEESFVKGADVEICYRMLLLTDYKIAFNPGALVWEPGEPTLRALLQQRFRIGIGWNLLRMKYPELYRRARGDMRLRRAYWRLHGFVRRAARIAGVNLRSLLGSKQEEAVDENVRLLMNAAQSCGRVFGRWYLASKGIRPESVAAPVISRFLEGRGRLTERVTVVGGGGPATTSLEGAA